MRFRKLRIAWSVFWGVACVLLIVLWVRSYWWWDSAVKTTVSGARLAFAMRQGALIAFRSTDPAMPLYPAEWEIGHHDLSNERAETFPWFLSYYKDKTDTGLLIRFWLVLLALLVCGALPWLHWRFALRTLLIATTLVAVLLGLIVWLR